MGYLAYLEFNRSCLDMWLIYWPVRKTVWSERQIWKVIPVLCGIIEAKETLETLKGVRETFGAGVVVSMIIL